VKPAVRPKTRPREPFGTAPPSAAGKALQRAQVAQLRSHDLRHTFGTCVIATARFKDWMGHSDVATTMRYLHFVRLNPCDDGLRWGATTWTNPRGALPPGRSGSVA
jgi:integrase